MAGRPFKSWRPKGEKALRGAEADKGHCEVDGRRRTEEEEGEWVAGDQTDKKEQGFGWL